MNERIEKLFEQVRVNEQIERLAKQAGCTIDRLGYGEGNMEKFAELIVKECAELTSQYQMGTTHLPNIIVSYNYSHKLEDVIKKHFGVEESQGWVCPKCGTDRTKTACPKGHSAVLTGDCPMYGVAHGVEE